jgi:A/G-specific adenine glycosylase
LGADSKRLRSPSARIVAWHKLHGRHDLPWQGTLDAYTIWLSEIMLQQTQVTTVIPYYEKFLEKFPTVEALAAAPLDAVLALWSGLGYYSRARNLHKAAGLIVERHGGRMPNDPEQVQALPGIGRSTAAAICVFAYGGRHAILDGNVKRVLARYCGVRGYPGEAKVQALLWDKAESLLSQKPGIVAYTQGLMDLGASLCARSKPQCTQCPLRADCVAYARGLTEILPTKKPRAALPQRATIMLLMRNAGEILLEKRAASGIWGGLWSLPEISSAREVSAAAKRYGVSVLARQALPDIAHGFTHFKLQIEPLLLEVKKSKQKIPNVMWMPVADAITAAIPTPVRKILVTI